MNVIITLAGKSQRFREAGFSKPKFLIEIDGSPMVEHVVNMFDYTDTFHFVINNDQLTTYPDLPEILNRLSCKTTLTVIEPHNIGPTYSARQVKGISNDDDVIVSYCDFFVKWDYQLFKKVNFSRLVDSGHGSHVLQGSY